MITSEVLATFVLSWTGVAILAALFCVWHWRKKLWKARKHLPQVWTAGKCCLALVGGVVWVVRAKTTVIFVLRILTLVCLAWYWWLWNRRYRSAKGTQRQVYYLPEGVNYADRERLAREARERAPDQMADPTGIRSPLAPAPVEAEASHE
jgi:hypothetical protein